MANRPVESRQSPYGLNFPTFHSKQGYWDLDLDQFCRGVKVKVVAGYRVRFYQKWGLHIVAVTLMR